MIPERCIKLSRLFFLERERPDSDLFHQLQEAFVTIDGAITIDLESHQKDALICLVSDLIGGYVDGEFVGSLMFKALNIGMRQISAAEFQNFCYRKSKLDEHAWQKRCCEQRLFVTGQLLFQ